MVVFLTALACSLIRSEPYIRPRNALKKYKYHINFWLFLSSRIFSINQNNVLHKIIFPHVIETK